HNTVQMGEGVWQLERISWRGTLAGCRVTICEHLDGQVSIVYGPHRVGLYTPEGQPLKPAKKRRAPRCGNDAPWKAGKTQTPSFPLFPPRLKSGQHRRIPTHYKRTPLFKVGVGMVYG